MTERKAGWYWVKNKNIGDNWIVAEWFDHYLEGLIWSSCGESFEDEQCQEIGPRIPSPDEPWKCVPVEATDDMTDGVQRMTEHWANDAEEIWPIMLAAAPSPGDNQ